MALAGHTEKAMTPHSSTLAWKIPWAEEPGGLQSMGSWRVRHNWATSLWLFTFMHWRRKWQPTPVFFPGESQGRGSLVGCRLWGRTELDTTEATWQQQHLVIVVLSPVFIDKALLWCLVLIQSCPTLFNPRDCSLPDSSAHAILQARIIQWVAICFSRRSSWSRDQTCISCVFCIGIQILYHWPTWEVPDEA